MHEAASRGQSAPGLPDSLVDVPSRPAAQTKADAGAAPAPNRTGISTPVLRSMERGLGRDLSAIRVHPESGEATRLGAQAFTRGNDIHVAPGRFAPHTESGRALIGHELAHVVQQANGRVRPTTKVAGVPVNDDPGLEREADAVGARLARESGGPHVGG